MRICTDQNLARQIESFFRQGDVADTFIAVRTNIVKVVVRVKKDQSNRRRAMSTRRYL